MLISSLLQFVVVFQAVNCKGQHSISYTLSRNQTVVVEYSHDKDTDMFQVNKQTNKQGHVFGMTLSGRLIAANDRPPLSIHNNSPGPNCSHIPHLTVLCVNFRLFYTFIEIKNRIINKPRLQNPGCVALIVPLLFSSMYN